MKRHTVARIIAVILLSYACAFLFVSVDKSNMAEYRSLSHEALLANLAKSNQADFSANFGTGLLVLGLAVLVVDVLTALVELTINRIAPLHPPGTSAPVADASGTHIH
jgi:hypothetical protein